MTEFKKHELDILKSNIVKTLDDGLPWSIRAKNIQKLIGSKAEIDLVALGKELKLLDIGYVYFCQDLSEEFNSITDLKYDFDQHLSGLRPEIVYVVSFSTLMEIDGETYRRLLSSQTILGTEFTLVFSLYRNLEAVRNGWPLASFIEFHFK